MLKCWAPGWISDLGGDVGGIISAQRLTMQTIRGLARERFMKRY